MQKIEKEKNVEAYLVNRCRYLGGRAIKIQGAGNAGMPDRICVFPNVTFFVETKTTGQKLRKLQVSTITRLTREGHTVLVADSKARVDQILNNNVC